jgi:hypothetical protein
MPTILWRLFAMIENSMANDECWYLSERPLDGVLEDNEEEGTEEEEGEGQIVFVWV